MPSNSFSGFGHCTHRTTRPVLGKTPLPWNKFSPGTGCFGFLSTELSLHMSPSTPLHSPPEMGISIPHQISITMGTCMFPTHYLAYSESIIYIYILLKYQVIYKREESSRQRSKNIQRKLIKDLFLAHFLSHPIPPRPFAMSVINNQWFYTFWGSWGRTCHTNPLCQASGGLRRQLPTCAVAPEHPSAAVQHEEELCLPLIYGVWQKWKDKTDPPCSSPGVFHPSCPCYCHRHGLLYLHRQDIYLAQTLEPS